MAFLKDFKISIIVPIVVLLIFSSLLNPAVGQAKPQLLDVYINGSFKFSPNPIYLSATALYDDGTTKDVTTLGYWESSDEDIAEVDKGKVVFGRKAGDVEITFTFNRYEDNVKTKVIDVEEIAIRDKEIKYSNDPVKIRLKGDFDDYDDDEVDINDYLTWFSSDPEIAEVFPNGILRFTGEIGDTTVGFIYTSPVTRKRIKDDILITVTEEDIANLDDDDDDDDDDDEKISYPFLIIEGELDPEEEENVLKAYTLAKGNEKEAIDSSLIYWSSTNRDVATVSKDGVVTYTGKPGYATIIAEYGRWEVKKSVFVPYQVEQIQINESLNFTPYWFSKPPRLTVTGIENGGDKKILDDVEWSSSDQSIATIDNSGQINFTGKEGSVTFTAEVDQLEDTISTTVPPLEDKKIQGIYLSPSLFYSQVPQQLKGYAIYGDGSIEEVTDQCTWFSSNEKVATIYNGTVYFSGLPGIVEISCTYQGFSDKDKLIVFSPTGTKRLSYIKFKDHYLTSLDNGKEINVLGIYSDNTTKELKDVTFSSYQPNIAQVVNGQLEVYGNPGTAIIEAQKSSFRNTVNVQVSQKIAADQLKHFFIEGELNKSRGLVKLKAYAVYANNQKVDVTSQSIWNTSNKSIAKIEGNGLIQLIDDGSVKISATYNNKISYISNNSYYQFNDDTPLKSIVPTDSIKQEIIVKLAEDSTTGNVPQDIQGHWAEKEMKLAYGFNWITKDSAALLRPDSPITRGDFADFLCSALNLSSDYLINNLTDIQDHSAKKDILTVLNLGLISYPTDNKFRPYADLTRRELAEILSNLFDVQLDMNFTFIDVPSSHPSYLNIAKVAQVGLMRGIDTLHFGPDEKVTRAQAVTAVIRLLQLDEELNDVLNKASSTK